MVGWIALGIGVVVVLWVVAVYNGLIQLRVGADGAWSDISVQLKRRYDLIPNLVETVKGYAAHEQKVFIQVSEARSPTRSWSPSPERKARSNWPLSPGVARSAKP